MELLAPGYGRIHEEAVPRLFGPNREEMRAMQAAVAGS